MKKSDEISAFPYNNSWDERKGWDLREKGMTLRDYFASKAMQGYVAGVLSDENVGFVAKDCAKMAYEIADAMIEERSKEK